MIHPPSAKFHDKMTTLRLNTFSTISTNTSRMKVQNLVLRADRNLFSQMILVAESRSVNMKDVLAHPLDPLLWAVANADGFLWKTNKAALARDTEKNVSPAEAITTPSTCIIDGMGLVQRINGNNNTFAQLVESVLSTVLYVGWHSGRVDVVFDVCCQPSINYSETEVHAQPFSTNAWQRDTTYSSGEKCLCSSFTKTGLIKFVVGEWKLQRYRDMQQGKALYDTYEETYFKMTTYEWVEVAELQSTQEEADTCLLLHALHAARTGAKAVIVTAEYIDVMLLCFAFKKDIPCPIYQKMCVTQNRTRFVDISKLAWPLGDIICGSLIRLHSVTPWAPSSVEGSWVPWSSLKAA